MRRSLGIYVLSVCTAAGLIHIALQAKRIQNDDAALGRVVSVSQPKPVANAAAPAQPACDEEAARDAALYSLPRDFVLFGAEDTAAEIKLHRERIACIREWANTLKDECAKNANLFWLDNCSESIDSAERSIQTGEEERRDRLWKQQMREDEARRRRYIKETNFPKASCPTVERR